MPYSITYRRWASRRCRLKINGFDIPPPWLPVARRAMRIWNTAGADFQFIEDPSSSSSLVCEELGDNGWVGLTSIRPLHDEANIAQVLIRLNTRWPFNPPHPSTQPQAKVEPFDLFSVVLHELGHALHLGEDYSPESDTIMRPTIDPGEVRALADDDKTAIKLLYP